MKYILDTSAYSGFNRGDERLRAWVSPEHTIVIPLIVIGELRCGFACGNQRAANEKLLQRFLDAPNVQVVDLTLTTTNHFAEIYLQLRKSGKPIGTNDIWITALCQQHNLPLLTLDSDFSNIPTLKTLPL